MRELAQEVNWEEASARGLEDEYSYFVERVKELTQECVPQQQPFRKKKNIYLTTATLQLVKEKKKSWNNYTKASTDRTKGVTWDDFKRKRNDLRRLTRRLRKGYQQKLASQVKENPKAFWSYAHSQTKLRPKVEALQKSDGSIAFVYLSISPL